MNRLQISGLLWMCELKLNVTVCLSGFFNFAEHTKTNNVQQIQSPGFPNSPYPSNTFIQWQLRADPSYVIKLDFDTMNLEEDCKNDFVKIYDSLVAIESRVMEEWVCPLPRLVTALTHSALFALICMLADLLGEDFFLCARPSAGQMLFLWWILTVYEDAVAQLSLDWNSW